MNKTIKIFFNYFIGPLLLLGFSISIFQQIKNQSTIHASWLFVKNSVSSPSILYVFMVLLLMVTNWALEAWKWKLAVQKVQTVSFATACKAILSGVSFSVTLPNRMGEYLGRLFFMEHGKRLRMIALTIVGSMSQLLVTLFFGIAGVVFFRKIFFVESVTQFSATLAPFVLGSSVAALLILLLLYFQLQILGRWLASLKWLQKCNYIFEELNSTEKKLLLQLILISTARYIVFLLQYLLLFQFFGVEMDRLQAVGATTIMFLLMALIPTIALFEVVQKVFIAKELFAVLTPNLLGVGLVTATIWLINLLIPAAVGSLVMMRKTSLKK